MDIKFQNKTKLVVTEKGKTLGYLDFSIPDDKAGKRNLSIDYIYVSPKYRRMGIATKMMEAVIEKFKNKVTWISLWTGAEMEATGTWALYKKLGFKQLAVQEDYYQDGVATRLFAKKFN